MNQNPAESMRTPFVDEALLEQRQQQREVLLSIPGWLAHKVLETEPSERSSEPVVQHPAAPPTPAQEVLVERHARDRVDDLLDQLQDDLAAVIDRGVAETIVAHLVTVTNRRPSPATDRWRNDLTDELMIEVDVDEGALGELVDLLLMADDLADDGFADLRFS